MFGKNKYKIDYCGQKGAYKDAKDSYRAGEKVRLVYYMIATDTDYSFYLDGEHFAPGYSDREGYIISFTMPEHDVILKCEHVNSMTCIL